LEPHLETPVQPYHTQCLVFDRGKPLDEAWPQRAQRGL